MKLITQGNFRTIYKSDINERDSDIDDRDFNPLHDLKERLLKVTPTISEVSRNSYDNALEDLPIRLTYTSSERHLKVSAEVIVNCFVIRSDRARET